MARKTETPVAETPAPAAVETATPAPKKTRAKKTETPATTPAEKPTKVKAEKKEKPAKPVREPLLKQHGQTRPRAGGLTARPWEIADEISVREKRPAKRAEVMEAYLREKPDGSLTMCATQYGRWRTFFGLGREERPAKVKAETPAATTPTTVTAEQAPALVPVEVTPPPAVATA